MAGLHGTACWTGWTAWYTFPGYGFFIEKGYVTWPERWHECNSIMHGCLNGIGGWFVHGLAGYRNTLIKPSMPGALEWVKGYHDSPYGRIICNWKKQEDFLEYGNKIISFIERMALKEPNWTMQEPNYEGIRIRCSNPRGNGWFLLRLSLHDPLMPLNIESDVEGGVEAMASRLGQLLKEFNYLDTSSLI